METMSGAAVLEAVQNLCPKIVARSEETEANGLVAPDLFDELEATGFFLSLWPRDHGGTDLSLADVNEMIIEGARADGTIGWLMMIGVALPLAVGLLPEDSVKELFGTQPVRARGTIAPKGRAEAVEGGYRVSGQWPFASGGPAPDFVLGHSIIFDGDKPRIGPSGMPDTVLAFMPASEVEFLDTWHVVGLKGTNSCDVVAHEVFVPERFTFNIFTAVSCFDTAACQLPFRPAVATCHSAFAIGVARGALDDIAALAVTKRAAMNPTARLAEDVVFEHQLGEQDLRLHAAKAFLDSATANAHDAAVEGRPLTPLEVLRLRLMAGYITAECVKVVDAAYTWAGSTSLYETSTLQRRLRDIHVATQHVAATSEAYRTLGKLLAGEEVQPMELF